MRVSAFLMILRIQIPCIRQTAKDGNPESERDSHQGLWCDTVVGFLPRGVDSIQQCQGLISFRLVVQAFVMLMESFGYACSNSDS